MRSKSLKKVLAAALAATMVMASTLTVCATTQNSGGGSSQSSSSEESVPATYAEKKSQKADATIKVGGQVVKTSIAGVYAAEKVQGCAITTPVAKLTEVLGLSDGQKAAIIIYDTDEKKSTKAMASVNAAVEALGGGETVATLNIDLGAKKDGKWVALTDGSVGMSTGLPKDADTTKTYVVICVQPGGVTTILEDQDTNPKTVTFAVQAGLGTYALVAK